MMVKFEGQSRHKVYEPSKPTEWGLKFYCLVCQAHFLYWFRLHKKREAVEDEVLRSLCNSALDTLPSGMGQYKCYWDNYYGGDKLTLDTVKRGYGITCTARSNRTTSLFKEGTMTLMKAHEGLKLFSCLVTEQEENRFACVSWKDKGSQPTNFYSNIHSNEVTKVLRSFKGRKRNYSYVARDYTVNGMGHVDAYNLNMVNQKPTIGMPLGGDVVFIPC